MPDTYISDRHLGARYNVHHLPPRSFPIHPSAIPANGSSAAVGTGAASNRFVYRVSGRGTADRSSARVVQTIYATVE